MRHLYYSLLLLASVSFASTNANAQVTIGATTPPQSFSALELISGTNKGLRLPQMSNDDKIAAFGADNAVLTAAGVKAQGLEIFNTTYCRVETWNGVVWIRDGNDPCQGQTTVTDIEGHVYKILQFGCNAGCWMTENLATTTYPDGTAIPQKNNTNQNNAPYYWIPNKTPNGGGLTADEISNAYTYRVGLLYTWSAAAYPRATDAGGDTENDPNQTVYQGVCPQGWHLPSDYEWNQLEKEIATNYSDYSTMPSASAAWQTSWETSTGYRGAHGQAMKSKNSPVNNSTATGGYSKTSDLGFNGLLVGYVYGNFSGYYGVTANYWSSSTNGSAAAWYRGLYNSMAGMTREAPGRHSLYSVRCKKNE